MEARNYKDKNFSVALNDRMHGIELRFENKMSNDDIADVKDAGFKWSKRQQLWYAYQNEKAIAFANSLIEDAEFARKDREDPQIQYAKEQSKTQNTIRENHEILQRSDTITLEELAELVRQRAELDKRIAEVQKVISKGKTVDVSSDQAKDLLLATQGVEQSEPTVVERVIPESEYAKTQRETAEKTIEQIENERATNEAAEITEDDLKTAKKFLPTQEYYTMLGYANGGEESEHYKQKIKHVAEMGRLLYKNRGGKSYNEETKLHDKGFMHYYYGGSDFYICEVDEDGRAFGYTVLNGDTAMSEYGYTMLSEITSLGEGKLGEVELDLHIDDSVPMERAINQKYPGLFAEEKEQEIENEQSLADYIMSASTKTLNELNSNKGISDDEKFKELARRMKAALDAKKIDGLSQEVYAALEDENYHTENHILGLMGYYGAESKQKEIETYNLYPAGYTGMFSIENKETIYEVAGVEQEGISPNRYDTIATSLFNDLYAGATEDYDEHLRDDLGISDSEMNYLWVGPNSRQKLTQISDERMKALAEILAAEAVESYNEYFSETMEGLGITEDEVKILLHENEKNIEYAEHNAVIQNNAKEIFETAKKISDRIDGQHIKPADMKKIREEAKRILAGHTDEEIREDGDMLSVLAQYEGGGGLSNEKERTAAEVLNAFYTPRNVVEAVWKLADHYAPEAKTVLEPSSGIGRFAENRPNNQFTLRELDETSARIAKILHPDAEVIQGAFERQFFDADGRVHLGMMEPPKYDIVIGNPPYGENKSVWRGRGEGTDFVRVEEYFLSRGLDSLKDENSVLLYVMPSSFLKNSDNYAKDILAPKGKIIDAYRLPNGAFNSTDVGTDIIVFKRNEAHKQIIDYSDDLNEMPEEKRSELGKAISENKRNFSDDNWFKAHPEKILGEEYTAKDRWGKYVVMVRPHEGKTLQDELDEIAKQIAPTKQIRSLPQEAIEKTGLQKSFNGFYVRAKGNTQIVAQDLDAKKAVSLAYSLAWEAAQNGSKTQYEIYARTDEAMLISDDELKGFRVANQLGAESVYFGEDVTTLYNTKNVGKETAELYKQIERELNAALSEESERQNMREYDKNIAPLVEAVFKENPLFDLTSYDQAWRNIDTSEIRDKLDALEREVNKMIKLDPRLPEKELELAKVRAEYDARIQQKENARKELDEKQAEHYKLMHEKILLLEGIYKDNNVPWTVLESLHENASKAIDDAYKTIRDMEDDGETDYLEDFEKPEVQNRLNKNRIRKLAAEAVLHERNPKWLLGKVAAREIVQDQKLRTYNFWQKTKSTEELAKYIKKEFGQGGGGNSDSYYESHSGKGIEIALNEYESDFSERKTTNYTWSQVANVVKDLIESNRYLTEEELQSPRLQTAIPFSIAENNNVDKDEENEIDGDDEIEPTATPKPYNNAGEFTQTEFDKMKAAIADKARRNITDTFGTIENRGREYLVHIVHTADEEKRFAVYGDDAEYSCTITPTHLDLQDGYESFVQFARDKINDTLGIGFSIDDEEYLNRLSEAFDVNAAMNGELIKHAEADAQEFYEDSIQKENGYSFKEYAAGQMAIGFILDKFPEVRKFATDNIGFNLDEIGTKIAAGEITKENLQSELDKVMRENSGYVQGKYHAAQPLSINEKASVALEKIGIKWVQNKDAKSYTAVFQYQEEIAPNEYEFHIIKTATFQNEKELLQEEIKMAKQFNAEEFANVLLGKSTSEENGELDSVATDKQKARAIAIVQDIENIFNRALPKIEKLYAEGFSEIQSNATSTPQNPIVQKKPGDTLSIEEFSRFYGKEFDPMEFAIWKATNWEGKIDVSKLTAEQIENLRSSENFVETEPGEFTHKALFLSGDIGAKIREYESKIYRMERFAAGYEGKNFDREFAEWVDSDPAKQKSLFQKNIAILQQALPKPIPMEKLHFGLNTTIAEEFKIPETLSSGDTVDLNLQEKFVLWAQGLKSWQDVLDDERYYRTSMDWATANVSREEFPDNVDWYDIIEYIDKKPVKADPTHKGYGMTEEDVAAMKAQRKREADEKRMARAETADRLFDRFLHEGLTQEEQRLVEAEYNKRFNSYVAPDYSKLPLFIDGMSAFKDGDRFKLYGQQIKGISFLCNKGNGLLAYDVGVGKTAAGIVLNNSQLQLERSSRPLIVVPNSVYTKWYNDLRELFPNVPVNDLYNLNKESTEKFRDGENPHKLNIPENSISLVTYEALTRNITFRDETCENELYEDFSRLLSEDVPEGGAEDERNSTQKAKDAGKITNAIGTASQVKNPSYVFFEDCGWDNITVDEAHNFKNLWTIPRPKNKGESNEFSGIPTGKPSQRALKLYAMTQYVQKHNDNRNVFLLTATPFTNSPLEVYSMLSYVGRQRLIDSGIYSLRDFLNQFAHTKLEIAVNARGEIDYKQVMKDWKELPALQNMLTEYIDKVDGEEAGIIRPRKFTHVKDLDPTVLQKKMIEADTDHMIEIKEGNSAAVIVSMNAMRLALVAPALGDRTRYNFALPSMEQLVETSPKLKFVCDSIIEMYKTNPEKGQFMYMPLGQQAHGIVKDYLVQHGIPKEAVEVINGSVNNSVEKKEKITSCFNDEKDKLKIIIGGKNTSEGIDLNGNSFVMYNCSLGWNPSETIQAEGRVWRQGNMQGHVHCVYPVMNDSIDSVLYQKHDEKRSRINDLWTYKGDNLNVEDIKPEDLKFDLIKDPRKRAKLVLDEMTKELKAELQKTKTRIESYDEVVEKKVSLKEQLEEAQAQLSYRENLKKDYEPNGLEVPSWLKMEIAEAKKNIKSTTAKMETVQSKLDKLGIHSDDESAAYIRNLNVQKHELEKQIEMKQNELPDILKQMKIELMEKKLTLPPVEEQRKELCADITSNLRPMEDVEVEIKQERFEKMLEDQFQHGEITKDEFDLYKSAGYKNYEKWREGEIESLESIPEEISYEDVGMGKADFDAIFKKEQSAYLNPIGKPKTTVAESVVSEKPVEQQGNLFEEEYLDSLGVKQNEVPAQEKQEIKISDIAQAVKEKIQERTGASDEWVKNHLIVSAPQPKKQAAGMEY